MGDDRLARPPLLRDEVRRRLLEGLLAGRPAPGEGIVEMTLAAELGVSRTPLREALHALEREGFLLAEPRRGYFVAPLTAREAEESYPILWTLEALALRSGASPSSAQIELLEQLNRRLDGAGDAVEIGLELDVRWHRALLGGCGNQRLLAMVDSARALVWRYEAAAAHATGRLAAAAAQHAEVIEALSAGRMAPALAALERNWRASLDRVLPWLAQQVTEATPDAAKRATHRAPRSTPKDVRRSR